MSYTYIPVDQLVGMISNCNLVNTKAIGIVKKQSLLDKHCNKNCEIVELGTFKSFNSKRHLHGKKVAAAKQSNNKNKPGI